jgi:hypothetical protein
MRARAIQPSTVLLELKAFYTIPELARASGMPYHFMRRLLESNGVTLLRAHRSVVVPLSEIRSRAPAIWNSLSALETLRSHRTRVQTANARQHPALASDHPVSRSDHPASATRQPALASEHPAVSIHHPASASRNTEGDGQ